MITEDAATVTCACNHLTAFSVLQVHTHTHTFTLTHACIHKHTHTCTLITTCAVWCNLFISSPVQSPADPTVSSSLIPILAVTLSVVGGAVFLVLAVAGVAYLIWRYVTVHGENTQHCTRSNTYILISTHTHSHIHTHTHTHTHTQNKHSTHIHNFLFA